MCGEVTPDLAQLLEMDMLEYFDKSKYYLWLLMFN